MITIDTIVRNVLLRKQYPRHFYLQALNNAKDCLRELNFDTLKVVNTNILIVGQYHAATLPCGYVDFSKVGVKVGQLVRPLVQQESINRLNNLDTACNKIDYTNNQDTQVAQGSYYGIGGLYWSSSHINNYGENTGGYFGRGAGFETDTFKIIIERNEIQFNESIPVGTEIVLEWIGDGLTCDAATHIDSYAQKTIEEYCLWQFKEQSRAYNEGEKERAKRLFDKEHAKLRGRKNGMTISDIKRSMQKGYMLSAKGA